jgi:hypothetical protein
MNTHADKKSENKSQSVANSLTKLESNGKSTFQFVDNRPEAIAQRRLQEMANNSPRALQLRALQEMANNSSQVSQLGDYQNIANSFFVSNTRKASGISDTNETIQREEKESAMTPSNVAQRVRIMRVFSDINLNSGTVNTLTALNAILTAHGINNFTVDEIFKRLRVGGHVGRDRSEMYTRADGVVLDQNVQIRIGNLNVGALNPIVDTSISKMVQTFYDNQTQGTLLSGFAPVGISENGHVIPRENLLGMIRNQLSSDIAGMPIKDVTVIGGNGFSVAAAAADNFIYTEGATLTAIVTALTSPTTAQNGVWNRVRSMANHNVYRAELKLGGIVNRRIFALKGHNVLSEVGNALH